MPERKPICPTCKGTGRKQGCPICGRIGKERKPKRKRTNEEIAEAERQKKLKYLLKLKELWDQATLDKWLESRRDYLELMTEIKLKTNRYYKLEDL